MMANAIGVTKVILQPSDIIYAKKGIATVPYDAPLSSFEAWLHDYVTNNDIDCLVLYNEFRPYNSIGYQLAKELNIECIVLELGLLRPDFITIYSREKDLFGYLAAEWDKVLHDKVELPDSKQGNRIKTVLTPSKIKQFAKAYTYSRLTTRVLKKYPHYIDQRTMSFRHHFGAAIRGGLRYQGREKQPKYNQILSNRWSKRYYLVPLQVHSDSQITVKSDYDSVSQFINEVVDSFEKFAPEDTKLIFKVHPIDRGYADYALLIKKLNQRFKKSRIVYLDRVQNPIILSHAIGTITINSSMGISSLIHNTPVKTMGKAAFDLEGLTYQGGLDSFWTSTEEVDEALVKKFISLLKRSSQGQGTFFQRLYAVKGHSKILWPEEFSYLFPEQ